MIVGLRVRYGKLNGIADLAANGASRIAHPIVGASGFFAYFIADLGERMLTAGRIGDLIGIVRIGTDLAANGTGIIVGLVAGAITFQTTPR